ncbi:AraC family transcriptional regulator [Alcanivorax sp. JB21]|uniref:AraC family transcriptional regulator n=1 Tax=Alcanivorax limicola TaxID=2874102 RepID=UPI001CBE75CF|nr:AraC family transcriptional regulator [Alcanivorax limicola]MBZ2188835.1 AraC family transcriptional regulator [Alcanivorax limicola]
MKIAQPDKMSNYSGHSASVSVRSVLPVLAYLQSKQLDVKKIPELARIKAVSLDDIEARVPHALAISVWERASRLAGDEHIGLHVAECVRPGSFGALEYAIRSSHDLGAGINRLVHYHRVMHDIAEVRLETAGKSAILSHCLPVPGGAPQPVSEFIMAGWYLAFCRLTGVRLRLDEVRFAHARPASVLEYQRIFNAPLSFSHDRSELVFPAGFLELPMLESDAELQRLLESVVMTMHENLPASEGIIGQVLRLLRDELCDGEPTMEAIARKLCLTPRTLHRRLKEEGTNFRVVVNTARRDLAERYLREGRMTITEIAFLLGYSDANAFHRAFKRWTGHAPRSQPVS